MIKTLAGLIAVVAVIAIGAATLHSQAKPATNVILFIGDGAGVSSLNAASIYAYGQPQALYLQKQSHVALVDMSTAKEWVPDAAASASAWATGHKGRNGVVSMSPDAERGVRDGEIYKTVMEYAMEQGLAAGIISNENVAVAAVSAFYAHHNNRGKLGEIFQQALAPQHGQGPAVIIGAGRKQLQDQTSALGRDLLSDIRAHGYAYVDSMAGLTALDAKADRVVALFDDGEFDFNAAVQQAVARLSKSPRGFILVAHSDCHTGKARSSLQRLVDLDKTVSTVASRRKDDTLLLFTADHGYDLRIKGETLTETARSSDHTKILSAVSLEDQHTAEEVPLIAIGPGAERVAGFMSNTDVFGVMMSALGWRTN